METIIEEAESLPFELEFLTSAVNYQQWITSSVEPYLGQRILELGAGIGCMSRWIPVRDLFVVTEGYAPMLPHLRKMLAAHGKSDRVIIEQMDLNSIPFERLAEYDFDTVISFNVLEHIEKDRDLIKKLVEVLSRSKVSGPKRIVTFVPAHEWCFGEIDRHWGHFRRYERKSFSRMLKECCPDGRVEARYFNIFGLPGWFFMGRILKQSLIGDSAVRWFERLCPSIKGIDNFLHRQLNLPLGQSLIVVLEVNS